MKESPILMNTEMVKATIAETKTESRRMNGLETFNAYPDQWTLKQYIAGNGLGFQAFFVDNTGDDERQWGAKFPYGLPGDLIYVRETFLDNEIFPCSDYNEDPENEARYLFKADCSPEEQKQVMWTPSIHMPKEAARIWLQITHVRVERLQDICPIDAIQEGIEELTPWPEAPDRRRFKLYDWDGDVKTAASFDPIMSFYTLWISIYGQKSVLQNPWVWVIKFKKVKKEGGKPS